MSEGAETIDLDSFAGGGGASTGMRSALEKPVDIAINHSEAAIAMLAAMNSGYVSRLRDQDLPAEMRDALAKVGAK